MRKSLLEPETLVLTIASRQALATVRAVNHIETDILGKDTGETRMPGRLANAGEQREWKVDRDRRSD